MVNAQQILVLCGLIFVLGCSACMGQTRPAPDTSPMPTAASIAEQAGTEARRLEAERRSGVIFETSQPGEILTDGQAPVPQAPDEAADSEQEAEQGGDAGEENPLEDPSVEDVDAEPDEAEQN